MPSQSRRIRANAETFFFTTIFFCVCVPLSRQAYVFAEEAHQGQLRKSGEPYLTHPVGVASIIADMKVGLGFGFRV
jgi:(p)ppGpp synthase/HD superfamily hydrolase